MFQKLLLISLSLSLSLTILAQNDSLTAPIIWQKYKIGSQNVSMLFPKLPIIYTEDSPCYEMKNSRYVVYADRMVYGLDIITKTAFDNRDQLCKVKKDFSDANFTNRIDEIKKNPQFPITNESNLKINTFEVTKLTSKLKTFWLINDYANKRWFEFWVISDADRNREVKGFISSLELKSDPGAIEIGNGGQLLLGDENLNIENGKVGAVPLLIAIKPKALYTNGARQNQTQGTTRISVVFLANGTIGNISVVTSLPDGLTEQAIAAARRIVFIPQQINGENIAVTRQVEYSFTLY